MNLATLFTPLSLGVISILGFFLLVQLAIDMRRAAERRMARRQIMASVRKHESRRITVLIELKRGAASILPLLDHLDQHNYAKLQVVVIVKHTAGKNAVPTLQRYRRTHKPLHMRIVTHKKGIDKQMAVKRYATGELVLWLNANQRLSQDFFTAVSLPFMNSGLDGLSIRRHVRLDSRIRTATAAWKMLQHDMFTFGPAKNSESAFIFRRKSVVDDSVTYVHHTASAAIQNDSSTPTGHIGAQAIFFTALALSLILAVVFGQATAAYLPGATFLGFFLLMSSQLFSTVGYTLIDRINLILLLPLQPFLALGGSIRTVLRSPRIAVLSVTALVLGIADFTLYVTST